MASSIQAERRGRTSRPGTRRLAIARHAQGTDAIGWVLLGFVLGAAAAITALLHADFQTSQPPRTSTSVQTAPTPALLTPAVRATPPRLAATALAATTAVPTAAPAKAPGKPKRTPFEGAQVNEDAAAAGMTSRAPADIPDLY